MENFLSGDPAARLGGEWPDYASKLEFNTLVATHFSHWFDYSCGEGGGASGAPNSDKWRRRPQTHNIVFRD